jgi:LysM repeat protein
LKAPRQAGIRPRSPGARSHPVGVRACSSITRAEPAAGVSLASTVQLQPSTAQQPSTPQQTAVRHAVVRSIPADRAPEVRAERAAESSHLRLTRRGRVVLVAGAVMAASLLWFAVASAAQASAHGAPTRPGVPATSQVVVQPGQTLWSIAAQTDPTADPRLVVQRIVTINRLTSENITAGQHLLIP